MKTPICDFVRQYSDSNVKRLHMPGHKGKGFLGVEALDITEVDGADVLYNGDGIIAQSERNAAELFGTAKTLYSTEGSSLSIRAMLYLCLMLAKERGSATKIAAGRNAHKVFLSAAALLNIEIDWLCDADNVLSASVTPDDLENYLSYVNEKPVAVYVTSPDYLGSVADIKGLSAVCRKHGVLLAVDNAHGAYLRFLKEDKHPISLGADICCDSAHKTLPVLTGGGYLHIGKTAPKCVLEQAEDAMQMFASTSPSYLILQSLDANNRYLKNEYKDDLNSFVAVVDSLKIDLETAGYSLVGDEPLKVTVATKDYGYKGDELAGILQEKGIVPEFSDPDFLCFMLSPSNGSDVIVTLKEALLAIPKRESIAQPVPKVAEVKKFLSPREALLAPSEILPVDDCQGRVLATVSVSCPPAIPIVVCGELIDAVAIDRMKYYGITHCRVVKNK